MKINETLFLQVLSGDETENTKRYKTRIADLDSDSIAVEVPIEEHTGIFRLFEEGTRVLVQYKPNEGTTWQFETEVAGRREDAISLILLRRPQNSEIDRRQRRSFLRVPAALEVACRLGQHLQFLAVTEDVGGGGLSIVCGAHIPIRKADLLNCWLLIHYRSGLIEHVPFQAEIIRVEPLDDEKQLATMRFTEIAEAEQQKVIRFCFERQLEMRK